MELTLSLVIALVAVFALLYLVYFLAGKFGSPTGQRITGAVCLALFVIYAIHRLGLLDVGAIQL